MSLSSPMAVLIIREIPVNAGAIDSDIELHPWELCDFISFLLLLFCSNSIRKTVKKYPKGRMQGDKHPRNLVDLHQIPLKPPRSEGTWAVWWIWRSTIRCYELPQNHFIYTDRQRLPQNSQKQRRRSTPDLFCFNPKPMTAQIITSPTNIYHKTTMTRLLSAFHKRWWPSRAEFILFLTYSILE